MTNQLIWDGRPGHYEVYYLTLTDPRSRVGFWIRYTMLARISGPGEPATASLWFLAMDPRPGRTPTVGRKATFPAERLTARSDPFELAIDGAMLTDESMAGGFEDVAWDLRFAPSRRAYAHVHPLLARARVAQTMLTLPQADLAIDGTITVGAERFELSGAKGAQAHLWGAKHARSWAWVHCNDFLDADGAPVPDTVIDAVSVVVDRFGASFGPSTPVVGRLDGADFVSTGPARVVMNRSLFTLTGWRFVAVAGARKLLAEVDADRALLAGVTYHDPDGEPAYCYNTEVASLRLQVHHRLGHSSRWRYQHTLVAPGTAHFEYAQRTPIPGLALHTQ